MQFFDLLHRPTPLACQIGIAVTGLAGLALVPPQQGQMLLVPVTVAAAAALPRIATSHGTRIVGRGPGNSLVIDGHRASLLATAWSASILVLAAPQVGCRTQAAGS